MVEMSSAVDEHVRPARTFYVFPDGELVPISTMLRYAEAAGFEVRDVESLREHYALTLRHWVRRLEEHREEAIRLVGDTVYRIWRLYMAGSAYGFTTGRLNVYQVLLVKRTGEGHSGLPLMRQDWYRQVPACQSKMGRPIILSGSGEGRACEWGKRPYFHASCFSDSGGRRGPVAPPVFKTARRASQRRPRWVRLPSTPAPPHPL